MEREALQPWGLSTPMVRIIRLDVVRKSDWTGKVSHPGYAGVSSFLFLVLILVLHRLPPNRLQYQMSVC